HNCSMKLPVDLTSEMPGDMDQAAKLGSLAFMCTIMVNLTPSLASMDNNTLLANVIGISRIVQSDMAHPDSRSKTCCLLLILFEVSEGKIVYSSHRLKNWRNK
ncbi:hypothetical protein Tco_1518629, partial [Tanacetum coccineum]